MYSNKIKKSILNIDFMKIHKMLWYEIKADDKIIEVLSSALKVIIYRSSVGTS